MTKKSDTPAIRFKGFNDTWEQRKLNEIVSYHSSNLTASDAVDVGKFDLYDANSIIGKTDVEPMNTEYITVIKDGAGVGRIRLMPKNTMFIGTMGGLQANKSNTSFIFALLSRFELGKEFSGSTIPHIYFKDYGNNDYFIPSIDEQKVIGSYFSKIDRLITLHQRKYEKLHNIKKSMLEKMFPQNGSNVPEIRFKGFTDAWEQRKLGEVGSVSMCRRIFKEQTSENGDIPFYKIGTFGGEPDAFISKELFEEYRVKYPYPKKGDILISASGSIGRTVEFTGENEYFQDSNIVWLSHDKCLDNAFLKCFYSVVKWAGIEGSTIKRLYNDNILNTVITLPTVEEQKKIGAYFDNLDRLITLHQRELEKLQNIKKSMLEKMFV